MATTRGSAINFGFTSTANGATITNITGIIQSAKLSEDGDVYGVQDADGDLVSETHFNPYKKLELELIITGSSAAGAITNSAIATNGAKGAYLPITACASLPEIVSNDWRIMESRVDKDNVSAAKLSFSLMRHAGVTGTAT